LQKEYRSPSIVTFRSTFDILTFDLRLSDLRPSTSSPQTGAAAMADVKPIPDGYHTATPYLIVKGAAQAIDFYKAAFGATELFRMAGPDGRVGHAEIKIGDSPIMLADEHPEMGAVSPTTLGASTVHMLLYVDDVDTAFPRAVEAGAEITKPVQDQFYGDRSGTVKDPFGHSWTIATHVEDVPPEEMASRAAAMELRG
jgi:PhnB protein